jgi:hypothetical protein
MADQPTSVVLDRKKVTEIEESLPLIVAQAQDLEIADNDDYIASTAMLDTLAKKQDVISRFFEEPVKQANSLHKWLTGQRSRFLMPLQQAETLLKRRRQAFRDEQERIRLAKVAEEQAVAKAEQEAAALAEAQQLHEIGEVEAANTIIERAVTAPPPPVHVPTSIPKEKGHSIRKTYKARIVNPALIKREFLMPDDTKINGVVSKLGMDAIAIVGGIEVYVEESEVIRRSKGAEDD